MKALLAEPRSQVAHPPAHPLSSPRPFPQRTLYFTQVASKSFSSHQNFLTLIFLSFFYWRDAILLSTTQISEVLSHPGGHSRGGDPGIKGVGSVRVLWPRGFPPKAPRESPATWPGLGAPGAPQSPSSPPPCRVLQKQGAWGRNPGCQLCRRPVHSQGPLCHTQPLRAAWDVN